MSKRSWKTKGLSRRLIAWLLCCVCLLGAAPISAIALEADSTPVVEETATVEPTEEATAIPEVTATASPTSTALPISDDTSAGTSGSEPETTTEVETDTTVEPEITLSLYDRLMACTSVAEVNAILGNLTVEDEAEMDGFTEEQNEALEAHLAELGYYDVTSLATKSATINSIVSNAVVTYYYYTNGKWVNGGTYTDGQTITIAYNRNDDPRYYVFFAKPADNYLLSTFSIVNQGTGSTSYDLYSVENVSRSNISNYPSIDSLVQEASNNGYLTMNGYMTSAAGSVTLNQYFTGTQPGLTVSATATPNDNVKPGDEVTFHVTITPQKANTGDTVTSFEVTSLTINGVTYENVTLTANGDGTYSTDVKYEATATDWQTGNISLNVSAQVGYEYVLPVKDRDDVGSKITTNSTIISSGTTTVTLATASSVAYTLNYDAPEGITPPETIPAAPTDGEQYYEGDLVTVKDYTRTNVDDPTNKGTWTFTGWKVNGEGNDKSASDTVTMGTEKILFVGTWTFTPYPNVNLTIRKTVSGNMGDQNKAFTFTVRVNDEDKTFTLKHGEEKTITVRVGDTITISEAADGYEPSYKVGNKDSKNGDTVTFTVGADDGDQTIVFTNTKNVTIDTGVILDKAPYILILAIAVIGIVMLTKRRRSHADD